MKRNKKTKRFWYIQDWGTYSNQTPIFIGYTIPEISKIIKKLNIKQEIKDLWAEDFEMTQDVFKTVSGGVWRNKDYTVMYLPILEDTWDLYETILHECVHLVIYSLGGYKMFINKTTNTIEEEGLAYQIEYLFRSIRRKIQDKIK